MGWFCMYLKIQSHENPILLDFCMHSYFSKWREMQWEQLPPQSIPKIYRSILL
jgi:hypothetical protein